MNRAATTTDMVVIRLQKCSLFRVKAEFEKVVSSSAEIYRSASSRRSDRGFWLVSTVRAWYAWRIWNGCLLNFIQ